MEAEIREYEEQLADVQLALEQEPSDELEEVRSELVGLIDELKQKLPKFHVGSTVLVNGEQPASVAAIHGTFPDYSYTVKFRGEQQHESEDSFPESSLSAAPGHDEPLEVKKNTQETLRPRKAEATAPRHTQNKRDAPIPAPEPADTSFEESRSKWQSFAKRNAKRKGGAGAGAGTSGGTSGGTTPKGVAKKPAVRRTHFASK